MAKESKQVQKMRALGFTDAEIADVLKCDKEIDQGKRVDFDLDIETEKAMKKLLRADRKTPAEPVKRTRKEDNTKRELISTISEALTAVGAEVEVTNVEREMTFTFNGTKYKVVLSAPRK